MPDNKDSKPKKAADQNASVNTSETKQTKGNILLVDDDKFLLDMYSMKFTALGFTIQSALSATDALTALRNGFAADAIVFDLIMPEHDGFSFLQSLAAEKLGKNAALIALTNESEDGVKAKALELGADRLITKATMIPSEVVGAVAEEIAKKHRA
ncbi:MAG TPA: response regulator [Candidatus Paceibacterota bacterium]